MYFFTEHPRISREHVIRGLSLGLVCILISWSGLLSPIEQWNLNLFFSLRGEVAPLTSLVVVSIDDTSFDEFGVGWPWPRSFHAELLDRIRQGQPSVIGLDIAFLEPSIRGTEDDRQFADAIARAGNVVLAAPLTMVKDVAYIKEELHTPIKELRDRAAGVGYTNLELENDASIQRATLFRQFQDQDIPSFAFAIYRAAVAKGLWERAVTNREFLINYRGGPRSFLTIPYYKVTRGEVPPETFTGKIVLVGATSPVLHDLYPTPFASQGDMPGVEIHANIIENIVQGIPLHRMSQGLGYLFACLAGVLAIWLTCNLGPVAALGATLCLAGAYEVGAFVTFSRGLGVMDTMIVMIPLLSGYGITVVHNFLAEKRQREILMQIFSKHVSPEVAEAIWQQREMLIAGGRIRSQSLVASVLFADLKGFTPLSERMSSQALLDWINEYMEIMAHLVMKHGGVIDDFYGDSIKADFGVPLRRINEADIAQDAINAVECAIAMTKELKRLNSLWHVRGLPTIGMRIGICTGEVVAGCQGSTQRMKYTTLGDTVNTASRLESFDKERVVSSVSQNLCRILIGSSTCAYLANRYLVRHYGNLILKGKAEPLNVYEVIGKRGDTSGRAREDDPRHALRIEVSGRASISNGVRADVLIRNLSVGGLAVSNRPNEIQTGKTVELIFQVPGLNLTVQTRGLVVWTAHDSAGFAFQSLHEEHRALLDQFIDQCR